MFGPVSVKQHERLLTAVPVAGIAIGVGMIAVMGLQRARENIVALLIYVGVVVLLYEFVWHAVSVRCSRPGCPGIMHRQVIQGENGIWIRYVCDSRLHVIETLAMDNRDGPASPLE